MGLLEPSVGIDRRLSSCTLCHEAEERAALPAAAKSETIVGREERFDGDVTQGTFEPWRVGRSLGDGAFAQVKLVQGLKSGRIAAVKTTEIESRKPRSLVFALKEALALIHLPAHPNIPPLLDFARTSKAIHTVLALAPGEELFTYVNDKPEGRLDEDEARRIVAGILEALRHVHAAGILHRDIKLDNVFYDTATGTVSLIDFGLATFVDENTILEEAVGCINFASPALLRLTNTRHGFRPKGGHSDLWALGVLAHGLLTGYFPFRSEDPWEMQLEIAAGVHLDLEEVSDLGKDFLATVLDPANEGLISAKSLLRHPWIAPVAPRPSGQLPQTAPPKLPSPVIDGRRAAKAAESALQKVLPGYLASIAPRRKDETDSIASLEVAEQLVEVARSGSDTTLVSGISEISIAVPKVPAPVKRKTTLKDKFFSPATRLFDRLRAGQKK